MRQGVQRAAVDPILVEHYQRWVSRTRDTPWGCLHSRNTIIERVIADGRSQVHLFCIDCGDNQGPLPKGFGAFAQRGFTFEEWEDFTSRRTVWRREQYRQQQEARNSEVRT